MRHHFIITLRHEHLKRTRLAGFCLLLFSFTAFSITGLGSSPRPGSHSPWLPLAAAVTFAGMIITAMRTRRGCDPFFRYWLPAAAAGWLFMPYTRWLAVLFLLFAFWETRAAKAPSISFSEAGISMNALFKRRIAWAELQSVRLKDGLLTLDFKNNRLFQRETSTGDATDEQAFNDWCLACTGNAGR